MENAVSGRTSTPSSSSSSVAVKLTEQAASTTLICMYFSLMCSALFDFPLPFRVKNLFFAFVAYYGLSATSAHCE